MFIVQFDSVAPTNMPTGFCLYICITLLVDSITLSLVVLGSIATSWLVGFSEISEALLSYFFCSIFFCFLIHLGGWGGVSKSSSSELLFSEALPVCLNRSFEKFSFSSYVGFARYLCSDSKFLCFGTHAISSKVFPALFIAVAVVPLVQWLVYM